MSARDRPMVKARPVYLNLLQIRLPLPGVVSIVHRISGAVLSLFGIALVLIGLQLSLVSPFPCAMTRPPLVQERTAATR